MESEQNSKSSQNENSVDMVDEESHSTLPESNNGRSDDFQKNKDIVIDVKNVSKKYCRKLKKSLMYGARDLVSEMTGRARKLELREHEFLAVRNASFQVRKGECVALLGPNGAGKSTLMKMLTGLIKPDNGRIRMRGKVSALIELGTGFNPILSGRENVFVNGSILGFSQEEIQDRFEDIVEFSGIEKEFVDAPIRMYSTGMRARLGFAVAAFLEPQILLLDEVLAVGDVGFRFKCFKHMQERIDSGMSIIIVSHAIGQLNRVATRSLVMSKRQIIFDGDFPEGLAKYEQLLIKEPNKAKKDIAVEQDAPRISEVQILNTGGKPCKDFQTGETIRVRLLLESATKVVGARVRVFIESGSTGVLGGFGSPLQGFEFDLIPPKTFVEVDLPNSPLLMGGYSINASLYGAEETDFLHRKSPGARFDVTGPRTNTFGMGEDGTIRFQHQWRSSYTE